MNKEYKPTNISEIAFSIVHTSEGIEGYSLDKNTDYLRDLDKRTILEFLNFPETKLKVVVKNNGKTTIVAHNKISNESIEIDGLGDHFLALVDVVSTAQEKTEELKNNPNTQLLNHDFIKNINGQLLSFRREEPGIGEYRNKDLKGHPLEVYLTIADENGEEQPSKCAVLETSINKNIKRRMKKLVDWTNEKAFKNGRDVLQDIAEFHTRFIQIHPFTDGNGRTARLLTNYLLLINGMPLVNIPTEQKDEYIAYLNYAMAPDELTYRCEGPLFKKYHGKIYAKQGKRTEDNKYTPLRDLIENNLIHEQNNEIFSHILDYKESGKFHADQVTPEQV